MDTNKNQKNSNSKLKMGQMPSPPDFLTKPAPISDGAPYPAMIEEHISSSMPKSIDFGLYQNAINDRKQAEMSAAEIYSQYLEVVAFNQKLLRTQRIFDRFKRRARMVYEFALNSRGQKSEEAQRARRHQLGVEKALNEAQMENESLRASNRAHEEAFQQILQKMGQAEAQMEQANHQFQTLAEEFDNRGILLEEADRHIQGYRTQIDVLNTSISEWHDKYSKIRDENLRYQNELRDIQLRESGISTLNNELANSMTKAQKRIYELEDTLERDSLETQAKIATIEAELDRYREQKRVEALLDKSKKLQSGEKVVLIPEAAPALLTSSDEKREQWNGFYQKWNHIINGLTSHSTSMNPKKNAEVSPPLPPLPEMVKENLDGELLSETGELEIL